MINNQWLSLLMDYLNSLRNAGWESQIKHDYGYVSSWVGSAMLLVAISIEERNRVLELARNAREYAKKDLSK